jgi:hypothetical protein
LSIGTQNKSIIASKPNHYSHATPLLVVSGLGLRLPRIGRI